MRVSDIESLCGNDSNENENNNNKKKEKEKETETSNNTILNLIKLKLWAQDMTTTICNF